MKPITIPLSIKKDFIYRTLQLIAELNKGIEGKYLIIESDESAYINSLADISDIGLRHKLMLEAFAKVLTE